MTHPGQCVSSVGNFSNIASSFVDAGIILFFKQLTSCRYVGVMVICTLHIQSNRSNKIHLTFYYLPRLNSLRGLKKCIHGTNTSKALVKHCFKKIAFFSLSVQALLGQFPDWESEWLFMSSQHCPGGDGVYTSYRELNHNLGEVPLRVKVLVQPLSGPNSGLVFEAPGAGAQRDDNTIMHYCGVVYNYDANLIRLYAPTKQNHWTGRIFCAGDFNLLSLVLIMDACVAIKSVV